MSKKSSKNRTEAIQKEDVLQAVVMCDSCTDAFSPLKSFITTALIPLVNTPLLDYTLEFLALSGVQEVILFCVSHADAIKQHVRGSKWSNTSSPMAITILVSEGCRSLGDAMRDLDAKSLVRGDFILLSSETIGNARLKPVLDRHRQRQKVDKGSVLTLVYKEASPGHRVRTRGDETVLATDAATGRVLFHQKVKRGGARLQLPAEVLMDHACVDLRFDLADTGVSICSPAVPQLFSDNFDFQTRDDFVRGLLLNEEILASTIYCHRLLAGEYAATVDTWPAYQAVSHDVVHRWVYPLVPDLPISEHRTAYMFLRLHSYRHRSVTLGRGCTLDEAVVVGEGSAVGENATLARCIVGDNVTIGANAVITDAYLWDNVVVEPGSVVTDCVIGHGSTIGRGSVLSSGCLVCPGTVVPVGAVHAGATLTARHADGASQLAPGAWLLPRDEEVPGLVVGDQGEEEEEGSSEGTASSGEMSDRESIPDDTHMFYREVIDSLARGYEDQLACDNLILEINSSRYAYNVSVKEVNFHVVRAILHLPADEGYFAALVKRLDYFEPILGNYIKRSRDAQLDCLQAIEEVAESKSELRVGVQKLLHLLYDKDILEENSILKWFHSPDPDLPSSAALRKQVSAFITWLQEADEESSSGD